MSKSDFQPLIDKLAARFNSWTVRKLSFAGRLELLQSVISSMINFWASVFILPKSCIQQIEPMCNGFLWRGTTTTAKGAKVSWDSVCKTKKTCSLGLRRIQGWNKVLGLKLIWLIFASAGSLWVSWVRMNLIGVHNFWTLTPDANSSWIWKSICKLRPLARPMLICELGSGLSASFWHDNWTDLGPLIEITGDRGPAVVGLNDYATVREALVDGDWWIARSRSRNPIISLLRQCLPDPDPIVSSETDDSYLWKVGSNPPSSKFSSSQTWKHLNPEGTKVDWYHQVWFSGRIPKHAFLTWVTIKNRLLTRDMLLSWGMPIPASCPLCNLCDETKQHLFFDCAYSNEVWSFFCSKTNLFPPTDFDRRLKWLKDHTRDRNLLLIVKLLFQANLYIIWKERNTRVHTSSSRPPSVLIEDIKQTIKLKILPLSRAQKLPLTATTLLQTWLSLFS